MINYQEEIEWAISDTGRKGYENIIKWLREVRFYDLPASIRWHNNFKGGLARHSWQVFQEALKLSRTLSLPLQSISLCSLLHDVCKFDKYYIDPKGEPKSTHVPQNGKHGLYSVEILTSLGLELHDDEKLAIWWHMGTDELSYNQYKNEYKEALSDPLCQIICKADHIASHSWYGALWLEEFNEAKKNNETHFVRQQVFKSTLALTSDDVYYSCTGKQVHLDLNPDALHENVFCEQEVTLKNPVRQFDTIYSVVKQDCLACAHEMREADSTDDLCVLNLASSKNPGGGVRSGAGAQEEYLFRCSDYYRFLYQYANSFDSYSHYKIPMNPKHRYPLSEFGGVYSHGVTVFRDTEANGYQLIDSPWRINFVAVSAYHLTYKADRIPKNMVDGTIRKIRAILRIAYNNGQRRLVLGAFGCGAFNNPPKHMAELFKSVLNELEFIGLFRQIRFAIIEDHNSLAQNFQSFASVFR